MLYVWISVLFMNGTTMNVQAHYPGIFRERGQMHLALQGVATCEGHARNLMRYSMDFTPESWNVPVIARVDYGCGVEA